LKRRIDAATRKRIRADFCKWGIKEPLQLLDVLDDPARSLEDRCEACWWIGWLQVRKGVPALLRLIAREDPDFHWSATMALGLLAERRATKILLRTRRNSAIYDIVKMRFPRFGISQIPQPKSRSSGSSEQARGRMATRQGC
jgi:hypothetical protein